MSTFVLNEKVKFILPAGYEYDSYPGESGRMVNEIHCGEYLDDFGSTEYEFKCGVLTQTFNEVGPGVTPDNLLETALREKFPDYMILPGKPKTAVAAMSASLADVVGGPLGLLFGMDKMTYILSGFVQTGSYELVMFTIGKTVEDDEEKRKLIRHLGTVLDAMRVDGRKIPAAGSISEQFMRKLGLWDGPTTSFSTQLPAAASASPSRPAPKSAAPAPAKRPDAKPAAGTYPPSYTPTSDDYTIKYGELRYFGSQEDLRSFVIPEGVKRISSICFSRCENLSEVIIPESVIEIGGLAFSNCSSLTKIVIPNSVTKIGDSAFFSCKGLTKIVIPESVTKIGESAFSHC